MHNHDSHDHSHWNGAHLPLNAPALAALLDSLPQHAGTFDSVQYPLPVAAAVTGSSTVDIAALRSRLQSLAGGDVKHVLEPLLVGAEVVESAMDDRAEFFITDGGVRDRVFMGSKWMAGWALVLGGHDTDRLIPALRERGFMVFTDQPGIADTTYLGSRDTSPVYFLQLMVRYGMVWGGIKPGDPHELGHYLERDMPGLVIITEPLAPLKYLVTLGLMKLGAPAVVPSSFPFPYGSHVVADTVEEILERGLRFDNLRVRFVHDEIISLPPFCRPENAQEKFSAAGRLAGTPKSFFCVRPGNVGRQPVSVVGTGDDTGVLVAVDQEGFSVDVSQTVEAAAIRALGFIEGVRGYDKKGVLVIETAEGVRVDWEKLGQAVYWQVRLAYPRITRLSVTVARGEECARLWPSVAEFKASRAEMVRAMSEETTQEFVVCTECRPFSLVHTCIVTPGRTPMCSSRTYATIKAAALFGNTWDPYKRRSEEHVALRRVFDRGETIDPVRGEYEGANRMYRESTGGVLNRVFLHSVRGFPHTSCGCFQALAFWIPEVAGLGVMGRGSKVTAPGGRTWDSLAYAAGGKQTDGVMGVSVAYVRSPQFLQGDGGRANLLWVDSDLLVKIRDTLPDGLHVATEKDVTSVEELKAFAGR